MNKEIALSLQNVNYWHTQEWSRKRLHVLQDINLEVYIGESFGFLGANGAGKTTTIKNILGLVHGRGAIHILGEPSTSSDARRCVGYVPEHPYFYDSLTVDETLTVFAKLLGIQNHLIPDRCDEVLKRVNFPKPKTTRMRALSKGLNQKVAIAQSILNNPKILLLDEPFSGLDPVGRKEIRQLLGELKSQGTTIFISSHILSDVESLCDRVSILKEGKLLGVIDLHENESLGRRVFEVVCRNYESAESDLRALAITSRQSERSLYLEFDREEVAKEALNKIFTSGASLHSYQVQQPSLEDVFFKFSEGKKDGC
jgi:ABC-2 type transport system ATP-binding protein